MKGFTSSGCWRLSSCKKTLRQVGAGWLAKLPQGGMLPSASGGCNRGGNALKPPVEAHQVGSLPCYRRVGRAKWLVQGQDCTGDVGGWCCLRTDHAACISSQACWCRCSPAKAAGKTTNTGVLDLHP